MHLMCLNSAVTMTKITSKDALKLDHVYKTFKQDNVLLLHTSLLYGHLTPTLNLERNARCLIIPVALLSFQWVLVTFSAHGRKNVRTCNQNIFLNDKRPAVYGREPDLKSASAIFTADLIRMICLLLSFQLWQSEIVLYLLVRTCYLRRQ